MIAAFDHPLLSGLVGDDELSAHIDAEAEMSAMLGFERELAQSEAELGLIPAEAGAAIVRALESFSPDLAALRHGVSRDGLAVPELVRQIRQAVGDPAAASVHFGATSQDVIDTAMVLGVKACLVVLDRRLQSLVTLFADLDRSFGGRSLTGYTRMQPALAITVTDRLATWRAPLERHLERLDALRRSVLVVQFGGAAGTLHTLGDRGPALRAMLAERLGLGDGPQWHAQRDPVAELGNWLSLVTGSLGKFGQDVALMAEIGREISLSGGGRSSAMAHKQNPVDAEVLVALARFNAVQLSGLHQSLVHEQERSGAAWTLEWLILPQMLMATGASTLAAAKLAESIASIGDKG